MPSNQDQADQWIEFWKETIASNPAAAQDMEDAVCPPEPAPDERAAPEDPAFLAQCHADVVSMCKGPVVWVSQLTTRSPKWGLVWRADFWGPKGQQALWPQRVACWKSDGGQLGMTISGAQHTKLELKA
jgi:hypothetical protein